MQRSFRYLTILFTVSAVLILAISYRLGPQQRQTWFLPVPVATGLWDATEIPPPPAAVQQLGSADMQGWLFSNLFRENVEGQVIATNKFEAYLDPVDTMETYGYSVTAQKRVPLFGKQGPVRSLIFRDFRDNRRVLMYYWQQYADGTTRADTAGGHQGDPLARFRIGLDTIFTATPSCLVRIYTQIHPADYKAIQARRNLNQVALALQAQVEKQAGNKAVLPKPTWLTSRVSSEETGNDMSYLTTKLTDFPEAEKDKEVLPLEAGNFWLMDSYVDGKKERHKDNYQVTGPIQVGGQTGTEIRITRDGKPWRREVYQRKGKIVYLMGTQDENSGLMRFDPPLPLVRYPLEEGTSLPWEGAFISDKGTYTARSLSRISGRETLQTASGQFHTLRVDTMISVTQNNSKNEIRFPSVRWLAPNFGFVRKGFVDKGRPGFAEVLRSKVR